MVQEGGMGEVSGLGSWDGWSEWVRKVGCSEWDRKVGWVLYVG